MFDYCTEIMEIMEMEMGGGWFTDCMGMATLACYKKEYCAASVKKYGGPGESVEGYAKEMLYLMVQIQYLDRFVKCNKML